MTPTIAVINECILSDGELAKVVAALQIQVTRDFAPAWGGDGANLIFVPRGTAPPAGSWWLVALGKSDLAGDLGYHEMTDAGNPLGKAFVEDDIAHGLSWSVTLSHELLEMLADPQANQVVVTPDGREFAREVCDPCEDDQFAYRIDGVRVSDFVLPCYFTRSDGETRFSFTGALRAPAPALLTGGYLSELVGGAWTQNFGIESKPDRARLHRWFHRRRLRGMAHDKRQRSLKKGKK